MTAAKLKTLSFAKPSRLSFLFLCLE